MSAAASYLCLENEHLSLGILPGVGGSIGFFRGKTLAGQWADILRPATPAAIRGKDPLGMGSFPLFPLSNRIANAAFNWAGKTYRFQPNLPPEPHSIHGDSWYRPWTVEHVGYDRIEISHTTINGDFPIKYRAAQEFTLASNRMTVTLSLQNLHDEKMPFGLGLHPYFIITPQTTITTRNPQVWLTGPDAIPEKNVATPAAWDMSRGLNVNGVSMDNCFTGGDGKVVVSWPENRCALEMTADLPMHNLVVYIPAHHHFFCAELVSNATAALNRLDAPHPYDNLLWLEPKQVVQAKQYFSLVSNPL
jgi:aldose 1-epimerase